MKQELINKYFFRLFTFTFIFGFLLYGTIGYDDIDEICALLLVSLYTYTIFKNKDWGINKYFLITIFAFLFYLFYSFAISSNTPKGIIMDFIVQFKPFLGFFAVYQLAPLLNEKQKSILQLICKIALSLFFVLGLFIFKDHQIINKIMYHWSFYAACVMTVALIYYWCSNDKKIDKVIFLLMLGVGLFSTRSKFYGFYLLATSVILFFPYFKNFKLNIKTLLLFSTIIFGMIFVAWEKIDIYFAVSDAQETVESGTAARMVLYVTSFEILQDYFPFGSGFGSFASYASGVYYSPIYAKYGIDKVWGMTSSNYGFIADTYYPCLAQFGIIGIILYICFFIFIFRKSYNLYKSSQQDKYLIIPLLIIGYLLIESIADATFTSFRGYFIMMFLALVLSDQKQLSANNKD